MGDATLVFCWLSVPVSEPAFDGALEPSVVLGPELARCSSLPNPARRMIFIVGWLGGGLSIVDGAETRALSGVGLDKSEIERDP